VKWIDDAVQGLRLAKQIMKKHDSIGVINTGWTVAGKTQSLLRFEPEWKLNHKSPAPLPNNSAHRIGFEHRLEKFGRGTLIKESMNLAIDRLPFIHPFLTLHFPHFHIVQPSPSVETWEIRILQ
jgi:hypothetical protein